MTRFQDECCLLRELLRDRAAEAKFADLCGLTGKDKLFLMATCCAQVIAEVIWISSHYDKDEALEGLDALVDGIKDNIKRRATT
jgi:hypothetical protein